MLRQKLYRLKMEGWLELFARARLVGQKSELARLQEQKRNLLGTFLVAIIFLPVSLLPAQQAVSPTLADRITALLNQPKWESSFWGIHIVSLKSKEVLFSSNARKRFMPASNMKLLVGAAALQQLGPEFRFETPIFAEGPVDSQGRLLGNVVLAGRGDPNLEGRRYDPNQDDVPAFDLPPFITKVADQLVARGIQTIVGDVVADESYFVHEPFGASWALESLPWSYGAPSSALAVNENFFKLEFLPGETAGQPALYRTYPVATQVEVINKVTTVTAGKPPAMGMERSLDGQRFTFQGEIPLAHSGLRYNLSVVDPAEFAALQLKSGLTQRGVVVTGKAKTRQIPLLDVLQNGKFSVEKAKSLQTTYAEDKKLASITSVPLSDTLKILMKTSHNLYAEMLLRALGANATGVGSVQTGTDALEQFLLKTGTPKGIASLNDGSGLSRKNLLTPESIVRLLEHMNEHPYRDNFFDLLPVAGRDGTLKNRLKRTAAAERIFAKTGAVEFVSTLSGYATTQGGEKLAFSVMVNHEVISSNEIRDAIDEICKWMVEYDPATGVNVRTPAD
jgi:D-alanyl-D-alanine carboxypeptidase/D-alanyl-D-alanine-endopeptidase (penicillin-binding protein 4)